MVVVVVVEVVVVVVVVVVEVSLVSGRLVSSIAVTVSAKPSVVSAASLSKSWRVSSGSWSSWSCPTTEPVGDNQDMSRSVN